MRFRGTAAALVAAVAVSWSACDEAPTEQLQGPDPSFAKSGGDPLCATKNVPVKAYFGKQNAKPVSDALHELQSECNKANAVSAWSSGFYVLQKVDEDRGDPTAGGEIVAGVWSVMLRAEAKAVLAAQPLACDGCTLLPLDAARVASALKIGVYVVMDGADTDAVTWDGPPRWGIEPNVDGGSWGAVVGYAKALVFGYPLTQSGVLGDDQLIPTGFDWTVAPQPAEGEAVAVGSCVLSTGNNAALFSHLGANGVERLLPVGRLPSYCGSGLKADGWGQRITNLASRLIPLWPQELHATLLAGKLGSGKGRELSPFFGYDVYFEGVINFLTQPGDAPQYEGNPSAANWICDRDNPGGTAAGCNTGIRVQLLTAGLSVLDAEERVRLSIVAEDNNGSWTLYPLIPEAQPVRDPLVVAEFGLVYEWTDLALDKPGRYLLCVSNLDQDGALLEPNTTGLEFPLTCSEAFHINPN
jgi:hypothetical protein